MTTAARTLRRLLPVLLVLAVVPAAQPMPQPARQSLPPAAPRAARAAAPPAGLAAALGRAAGAAKISNLGIHVRDVASGETVFARRAADRFILASNTKLFTTAAALEVLGPGYFFETELAMRGTVDDDGTLSGDLAVIGGGDPLFSWRLPGGDPYLVFRAWAAALAERGVRRVDGALFLDHGLFDDQRTHPDWNPDRYLEWYQVPVDALGFFENVVRVRALPAPRAGQPARVVTEPGLDYFDVEGEVRTLPSWSGNRMIVHRPSGSEELRVRGGVYVGTDKLEKPISVEDPVALFGAALRQALAAYRIRIAGPARPAADLPGLIWEPVAVHRAALPEVLEATNHESNNLMADTLLKLVGAVRCGAGTWENGSRVVEEVVARIGGLDADRFTFVDGSGLARGNRMAPADVTRFLAGAWREPWIETYLESLPTGGSDPSSLKERLEEHRGRFRAKTGTIAGVSALSGYATGRSGRVYAFSVLVHGGVGPARTVQDAVVEAIVRSG